MCSRRPASSRRSIGHEADRPVCRAGAYRTMPGAATCSTGVDFSALRFAVLSGSTVPATLSSAFEDLLPNGTVVQAWGMTELQFGACSRPSDRARTSASKPSDGRRQVPSLRVTDREDRVLPSGEIGELHVRGCSLVLGLCAAIRDANRAGFHRRRLVPHRRSRQHGRGRQRPAARPHQGADQSWRREVQSDRHGDRHLGLTRRSRRSRSRRFPTSVLASAHRASWC